METDGQDGNGRDVEREGKGEGKTGAGASAVAGKAVRRCPRWTQPRRQQFLTELARTCNINHALRVVGMSGVGLRALKNRDQLFAEQVADAIQSGYERIETELLARALGTPQAASDGGGTGSEVGPGEMGPGFDPVLAMRLLQHHAAVQRPSRSNGGPPTRRATEREIEDALVGKLKGLAKRLALIP